MKGQENVDRAPTGQPAPSPALPATLRLGAVHLTVTDLDRSVDFYTNSIGMRLQGRGEGTAALGAGGEDLLFLHEEPGARRAGRHAGLYHFALLHSSREELARTAARLFATDTYVQGASDHGISEAIYLPDPDGNGIELYADRPREVWPDLSDPGWDGRPTPLDMEGLLETVAGEEVRREIDPNLVVGHVHLHVGELEQGLAFYRDAVGFDLMTFLPGAAAFVSAGGYHHHLGFNIWRGEGVGPAPDGTVGLRYWTVVLEDPEEVEEVRERLRAAGVETRDHEGGFLVRDPWDIPVVVSRHASA